MVTPRGPDAAQWNGCGGKRRRKGADEVPAKRRERRERVFADATVQEQGVSKILTIDLNDMAKELHIQ